MIAGWQQASLGLVEQAVRAEDEGDRTSVATGPLGCLLFVFRPAGTRCGEHPGPRAPVGF